MMSLTHHDSKLDLFSITHAGTWSWMRTDFSYDLIITEWDWESDKVGNMTTWLTAGELRIWHLHNPTTPKCASSGLSHNTSTRSQFYMGSNSSYTQLVHEPIMSEDACFAVKHSIKFQIRIDCGNFFQTLRFQQPFTVSSTKTMHILELLDYEDAKSLIPPQ